MPVLRVLPVLPVLPVLIIALTLTTATPLRLEAQAPAAPAGAPAPAATVSELQHTLAAATGRFQAMDSAGVLVYVSDRYRNGPITKSSVRDNLLAMFALYDTVRAQVRIDDVRLVNGTAWIYSTGEISGRLRGLGAWTTVLSWEREPEVARREGAAWRLEGPGP